MSKIAFTHTQRDAVEADGSVTVRAGAGSGKTAVLTARYVRAVEQGDTPSQLVALTFTEKAAAEMRERIRRALGETRAHTADEAARVARVREELTDAPINTIHGFCASILREFPIEAGVNPLFAVAEEAASLRLRRDAVDMAIAAVADDPRHGARPALDTLLTFYTRHEVARMLGDVLAKRRYFAQETRERMTLDPRVLLDEWQRLLEEETLAVARGIAVNTAVLSLLDTLRSLLEHCTKHSDLLYETAASALDYCGALRRDDKHAQLAAVAGLAEKLTAQSGPRRFGNKGSGANWPGDTLGEMRDTLGRLAQHMQPLLALRQIELDENDRLIAHVVHSLCRLADEVETHYAAAKGNGRVLDFDDLEERTLALLESERGRPVLDALRRRYRLILVDESQDLNLLQFRLVRLLIEAHGHHEPAGAFIVGDPQQSIFGFRNADVRLFSDIRSLLAPPSAAHKRLDENFRSTAVLVSFANRVFKELMVGGEAFHVEYNPMQAHRPRHFDSAIELLLPELPGTDDEETTPHDAIRAAVVAERIAALVEEERESLPCDRTGGEQELRPPRYSDVAVLVRTRKGIPALEDALRTRGISCAVYKGIGFYQTQAVRDLITCLRFLADPTNDLDLAGLLRSPLFALSDDGLFLLAHDRGEASLYEMLFTASRCPELSEQDREVVARATALLPSWLDTAQLLRPSALLRRILDATAAWATASATGTEGTFTKLLRVVRDLQKSAPTLPQLVAALDERIWNVQREGDELGEALQKNAVNIMTIHGAKGLEFPIVFVLGLDDDLTRGGRRSGLQTDPDLGLAVNVPPALRAKENTGLMYRLVGERTKRRELAEACRLFYVACTRAQDHLFLVGRAGTKLPRESWQRWLTDALGVADRLADGPSSFDVDLSDGAVLRIVRTPPPARVSVEEPHVPERAVARKGDAKVEQLLGMLAPISPEPHAPSLTVSQIEAFERCPRLFYARHVLGLQLDEYPMVPEDLSDAYAEEEEREDDQRLLGLVVHTLLEQFGATTSTTLDDIAARTARAFCFDDAAARVLAARATAIVRSFSASPLGASLLGVDSLGELPFAIRFDGAVVRGRMDRLVGGTPPLIAEFKLPHDPAGATRESLEPAYGFQLRAYALAAAKLLGAGAVRAAIVLPETGASFEWKYEADAFSRIESDLVERIGTITAATTALDRHEVFFAGPSCGRCVVCRSGAAVSATRT